MDVANFEVLRRDGLDVGARIRPTYHTLPVDIDRPLLTNAVH